MRGVTLYTLLSFLFVASFLVVPACTSKSNNMASLKTKWAELVGKTGEEAKATILQERPGLQVDILPEDSMMTMDMRDDRVRIMVNTAGKVVRAPSVG